MLEVSTKERLYTLTYRQGGQVKTKNFPHNGPVLSAMARGRDHCKRMGNIKFIMVKPLVVDLEHQEKIKETKGSYEEKDDTGEDSN